MVLIGTTPEASLLPVWVSPRASKTAFQGEHDGRIKIAVQAPPAGGAANEACLRFLARLLKTPRSHVTIHSGAASRRKTIRIAGLSPADLTKRLGVMIIDAKAANT